MFDSFGIINYLGILLIFAMGALVVINDHKSKNNWIYFLFTLSIIGWMISLYLGWQYVNYSDWNVVLFWMRAAYGFSILFLSFMTIFLYNFPRPTFYLPKIPKYIFLGSIPLLFLISTFTPAINESLIIQDGIYIQDAYGPLYFLYLISVVFNLITSAYLAISKLKKLHGIEKEKMSIVSHGYIAFIIIGALTNVILPLFGILIIQEYSQLLILIFIIPAYYAVHHYRFFNFSCYLLNFVRKLIFYVIFLFTFFFIFTLTAFLIPDRSLWFYNIPAVIIAILLMESAQKIIPQFTPSSLREFKNALSELKTKIYFCDSYQKLQSAIDQTFLIKLNLINAKIHIIRKKKIKADIPIYIKNQFTEYLKKYKKDVLIKDEIEFLKIKESLKKYLLSSMKKLDTDLCIPLFSENHLIGFITFKKKEGEKPYSEEWVKELIKTKKDLEVGLMNTLLKMNLQEESNIMQATIDRKTKDLRVKIQQIKDLLRQQSDFIAVTAHEFRTPLSIALFQLEEIVKNNNHKKRGKKQLEEDLKVIDDSLDNLKGLTQKLFAVQQYDLKKVKLSKEKVNIKKYIFDIYEDFSVLFKEKLINFELDDQLKKPVYVNLDKSQFGQVMQNILTNAYKFTPEKGEVELSVQKKRSNVLIKISDSGNGIDNKFKKIIFDKFRTKEMGSGIGLGLYISKKIIELHKGEIWFEDSDLGGAAFIIKL